MAFVRSTVVKGHRYYQVVESYRDKDRSAYPLVRVICHLGKSRSVAEKIRDLKREEAGEKRTTSRYRAKRKINELLEIQQKYSIS